MISARICLRSFTILWVDNRPSRSTPDSRATTSENPVDPFMPVWKKRNYDALNDILFNFVSGGAVVVR